MSIRAMTRVWDHAAAEGSTLLLLLALADFADDQGLCWPDVPTLAHKARISERHVKRLIDELATFGMIFKVRGTGRGHSNRYILLIGIPEHEIANHLLVTLPDCQDTIRAYCTERGLEVAAEPPKKVTPRHPLRTKKGDSTSPIPQKKGDMSDTKGDISNRNGDSAMSIDPSCDPSCDPSSSCATVPNRNADDDDSRSETSDPESADHRPSESHPHTPPSAAASPPLNETMAALKGIGASRRAQRELGHLPIAWVQRVIDERHHGPQDTGGIVDFLRDNPAPPGPRRPAAPPNETDDERIARVAAEIRGKKMNYHGGTS